MGGFFDLIYMEKGIKVKDVKRIIKKKERNLKRYGTKTI